MTAVATVLEQNLREASRWGTPLTRNSTSVATTPSMGSSDLRGFFDRHPSQEILDYLVTAYFPTEPRLQGGGSGIEAPPHAVFQKDTRGWVYPVGTR